MFIKNPRMFDFGFSDRKRQSDEETVYNKVNSTGDFMTFLINTALPTYIGISVGFYFIFVYFNIIVSLM